MEKPSELFDRDAEWADLARFSVNADLGAQLGLLYGRRRQGKTLMLELLAEGTGGFLFTGVQQSDAQNLADLSDAFAHHTRAPYPVRFDNWGQAIDSLLRLGEDSDGPVVVALDEFPYLMAENPAIASVIQNALSPRGRARRRSRTRLILCGSALSTMRGLLSGSAPLRGRATLDLIVSPFDFRDSAAFWKLDERWDLALRVNALVGGTPAYWDFCGGDTPRGPKDLDAWVVRTLLNPSSAMFREGRILLAEEPSISEPAPYYAVLAAIARGRTRRGEIAGELEKAQGAIHHPLTVLTEAALIEARDDAFRARRTTFALAEPILRFHQLVIRPHETRLSLRRGAQVWAEIADTVSSRIYGPHFEHVARRWALAHAGQDTLGGNASRVQPAVVACTEPTCDAPNHEIDLVVTEVNSGRADSVLAIGEAKWRTRPVGVGELQRLTHVRDVIPGRPTGVRLLLFSRSGFTTQVRESATATDDVELIDLERLYTGS